MARREEERKAADESVMTRFVSVAFPGTPAVRALTQEESQLAARSMFGAARGSKEIEVALRKRGLAPMLNRARAYTPFSHNRQRSKTVAVVPYASSDPDSNLVGGVGVSEGEPASGVVVELSGTKVTSFVTYDFIAEKLVERTVSSGQLVAEGPSKFVERNYKRGDMRRDLTVDQAAGIASDAFRVLLFDEHSSVVHTPTELREMAYNAPLVTAIAELQYLRLEGLTMSPDTSCCSCCCWGSCSSCSAVASNYLNRSYLPQWAS